jgi:hypothetical protein
LTQAIRQVCPLSGNGVVGSERRDSGWIVGKPEVMSEVEQTATTGFMR